MTAAQTIAPLQRFESSHRYDAMNQISLSPAEAAIVTGVMPATQRDWRHRALLSASSDGWTRFDPQGLAELSLLKILAAKGRMTEGSEAARALAGPLGRYFAASAGGESAPVPTDVAVIWADGSVGVSSSIQGAFDAATVEQQSGPMTVLTLEVLAVPLWIRLRAFLQEEGELVQ